MRSWDCQLQPSRAHRPSQPRTDKPTTATPSPGAAWVRNLPVSPRQPEKEPSCSTAPLPDRGPELLRTAAHPFQPPCLPPPANGDGGGSADHLRRRPVPRQTRHGNTRRGPQQQQAPARNPRQPAGSGGAAGLRRCRQPRPSLASYSPRGDGTAWAWTRSSSPCSPC